MAMCILNHFQHILSNSMDHHHSILPSLLMDLRHLLMDLRHHPSMENKQDTLSLLVMEQCQAILSRQWTLTILSQGVTERHWISGILSKVVMEPLHLGTDHLLRLIQLIHMLMGQLLLPLRHQVPTGIYHGSKPDILQFPLTGMLIRINHMDSNRNLLTHLKHNQSMLPYNQ